MNVAQIGPYALDAPLGRGGMGVVWAGHLIETGTPVAIKLLTRAAVADRWSRLRFQEEVRAVARLAHPNIVQIYDQGELQGEVDGLDTPDIGAGSLWFAMERAEGGALSGARGKARWGYISAVLQGMLRGLAHSHARGLLHRDIKPANVVVAHDHRREHPGRVVLLDFGLARAVAEAPHPDDRAVVVGTVGYMSPEQLRGQDERFGPWTDLYALGCVAWSLCTGGPPWRGEGGFSVVQRLLEAEPLPAFSPRTPVPPGLEGWIRALLAPEPLHRPRRAADVLRSLLALERATTAAGGEARDRGPSTERTGPSALSEQATVLRGEALQQAAPAAPLAAPSAAPQPALPEAPPREQPPHLGEGGAGLGLFRLRRPPLVGRGDEQEALWTALRQASAGEARAIVVEGDPGEGKSALLRWLAEQAAEPGYADVFTVLHADPAGPDSGVAAAVRRSLGLTAHSELSPAELALRVDAAGRAWGWGEDRLRDLRGLAGLADAERPRDRLPALTELFAAQSGGRLTLLIIEDAQWGEDAIELAHGLLRRAPGDGPPVLPVLSVRTAASSPRLSALLASPGALRLQLGPLPAGHQRQLAESLLPLAGPEAEALVLRAGGSPLLILQLLEVWVDSGALVPREGRLSLRRGGRALPADLATAWRARLDVALGGAADRWSPLVEIAAVLGFQVDGGEWRAAVPPAAQAELGPLLSALAAASLVVPEPRGSPGSFRFAHALLRDALLAHAATGGRLPNAKEACVRALSERPEAALRLGRLLLGLGRPEEAVAPLAAGAWRAVLASDYLVAAAALADRARALQLAGAPPQDPRWAEGWLTEARVARRRGAWAEARRAADLAASRARETRALSLWVQALREQSRIAGLEGRSTQAMLYAEDALKQAILAGEANTLAWCRRDLGLLLVAAGKRRAGLDNMLAAAQVHFQVADEPFGAASCLLARAIHGQRDGARAQTDAQLRLARSLLQRALDRQEPAQTLLALGEVARLSGRSAEAARWYTQANRRFEAIGHAGAPRLAAHLAMAELQRGRPKAARAALSAAAPEQEGPLVWLLTAWIWVAEGSAEPAARALDQALGPLTDVHVDPEVAELAERLGRAASAEGAAELSGRAWGLAAAVWTELGWGRRAKFAAARARSAQP